MSDVTAEFFDALAGAGRQPLLAKAKGVLRLELVDGAERDRWVVAFDKGEASVSQDDVDADCTVLMPKKLFVGMVRGEVNGTAALLRGALAVDGDLDLLVLFQRLFPSPPGSQGRAPAREEVPA